mmetsp:Transcript_18557/g.36411  ORF Transcript_18557/g.36411 Transcript_18557/m.36411 type:complete len:205 (-) Transcript_18557:41-655(-)
MVSEMILDLVHSWRLLKRSNDLIYLTSIIVAHSDGANLSLCTQLYQSSPCIPAIFSILLAARGGKGFAWEVDEYKVNVFYSELRQGCVENLVKSGTLSNGAGNLCCDKNIFPRNIRSFQSTANIWLCAIVICCVDVASTETQPLLNAVLNCASTKRSFCCPERKHGHLHIWRDFHTRYIRDCRSFGSKCAKETYSRPHQAHEQK